MLMNLLKILLSHEIKTSAGNRSCFQTELTEEKTVLKVFPHESIIVSWVHERLVSSLISSHFFPLTRIWERGAAASAGMPRQPCLVTFISFAGGTPSRSQARQET